MKTSEGVGGYFEQVRKVLTDLPLTAIERAAREIFSAQTQKRTIYLFGNGGSAALASHFACDLGKGTALEGSSTGRLRVVALTDNVPLLTAYANDTGYQNVFSGQLSNLVQAGDVAFAISGSGDSPNVLRALEVSREARAINIGLTGFQGGLMKALCDLCIVIPSNNMQIIEDLHLSVAHAIFLQVREMLAETALIVCADAIAH